MHAALTHEGSHRWDFQVHQIGLDLVEGKPYILRFRARANQPRKVVIQVVMDKNPWRSVGLSKYIELKPAWQSYEYSFVATQPEKDHTRVSFNLQNFVGDVWIADVELRSGGGPGLPDSASLEDGNIALPGDLHTAPQRTDFLEFAAETERNYALGMRDYVKNALGAKALVMDTQTQFGGIGGVYRESLLDFCDIHGYWEHPSFAGKQWDLTNWRIANAPMVGALGTDTLTRLAMCRVAGKPYTVTEYNHSAPNDYSAECMPMAAAFAALQDWDGIFIFDYHYSVDDLDRDHIANYFDIDSHPAKIMLMPAAAAIFRRGDVAPLSASTVMEFPSALIAADLRDHGDEYPRAWEACGFTRTEAMNARVAMRFVDKGEKAVVKRTPATSIPDVVWECEKGKRRTRRLLSTRRLREA